MPEKYRAPLLALAAAIIAATVYLPSLNAPFAYDDRHAIFQNPAAHGGVSVYKILTDPSSFSATPDMRMFRPLTLLSYRLNYAVAGLNVGAWHAFHIIFHAINAALLFFVALLILKDRRGAFAAAVIWAVHPLTSEAVIYQAARSNLLAATAVLGGFYLYASGNDSPLRRVLAALLFAVGLLCKETVVVLPALMIWYDANRRDWSEIKWARYIPYAAIIIVYIALRMWALNLETFQVSRPVRSVGNNLINQAGAIMLYLKEALWPVGLSIEHGLSPVNGIAPAGAPFWRWPLFAVPLLIIMAASAIYYRRKRVVWSMGVAWWLVALMPESSIIPLVQLANERRAYLPLAGLAIIAGAAFKHLASTAKWKAGVPAVIALICLTLLTLNREGDWKTLDSLWISAIKKAPQSTPALHGLASSKLDEGHIRSAEKLYRKIVVNDPGYYGAHVGLARLLIKKGDYAGAEEQLNAAISISQTQDLAWVTLSDLYIKIGSIQRAEQASRRAVENNPRSVQGWNNLGIALAQSGRIEEALDATTRSVSLDPAYAIGHLNRGNVLRQLGRMGEARDEYDVALRLDPNLSAAKKALNSME